MGNLVSVSYHDSHETRRLECDSARTLDAIMDDLMIHGHQVKSVRYAYGSTICVTYESGYTAFFNVVIRKKRSPSQ